jgi:hypothetical protein
VKDERARRALAIYREALNLQHFHSQPFSVLGFYKIIESVYPNGLARKKALAYEISALLKSKKISTIQLQELKLTLDSSPDEIASFLYNSGRQAVAHANKNPTINPDDMADQRQMSVAATLLRAIARSCMKRDFGLSDNPWDQNDSR